jgi:hypothetical protein
MSKSMKKTRRDDYDDDNDNYGFNRETAQHRREKRLTNILRSKDIDRLMEMEEDEE